MTEDEKIMERYGITSETNTTFLFEGHKYQHLEDAVNYAKKQQGAAGAEHDQLKADHE